MSRRASLGSLLVLLVVGLAFVPSVKDSRLPGSPGLAVGTGAVALALRDADDRPALLPGVSALLVALVLLIFVRLQRTSSELRSVRTDVERANHALSVERERGARIIEAIGRPIFLVSGDGLVRWSNRAAMALIGGEASELVGRSIDTVIELPGARSILASSGHDGARGRCIAKGGAVIPVTLGSTPLAGNDGRIDEVVVVVRDLRPTLRLQDNERRLELSVALAKAEMKRAEELERAREHAELANRAKDDFLANVSHEIRTPLNGIIGMNDILMETRMNQEQRECAELIHSSANGLLTLINDLLDFSKLDAGKLSLEDAEFDVRHEVECAVGSVAAAAESKGVALYVRVAPDVPPTVRGDPVRVRQIMVNLLSNAVKFTPEGSVGFDVTSTAVGDGRHRLSIDVEDTGIGIPIDKIGEIFERFTQADTSLTRRFGGTGLGLSIVRALATMMNGSVSARNLAGGGAHFRVELLLRADAVSRGRRLEGRQVALRVTDPRLALIVEEALIADGARIATDDRLAGHVVVCDVDDAGDHRLDGREADRRILLSSFHRRRGEPTAEVGTMPRVFASTRIVSRVAGSDAWSDAESKPSPEASPPSPSDAPLRTLLVEDNVVNRKLAIRLLELGGHAVATAENGREAIERLQKERFDIVLMDCQMPVMDGYEAARVIRRHPEWNSIPIIAFTAHAMEGDSQKCLSAGMDDYLTKPIRRKALDAMLAKWAGGAGARPKPADVSSSPARPSS